MRLVKIEGNGFPSQDVTIEKVKKAIQLIEAEGLAIQFGENLIKVKENGFKFHKIMGDNIYPLLFSVDISGGDMETTNSYLVNEMLDNEDTRTGTEELISNLREIAIHLVVYILNLLEETNAFKDIPNKVYKTSSNSSMLRIETRKKEEKVVIKIYNEFNNGISYKQDNSKVTVRINNTNQQERVIPSKLYPLPSKTGLRVFTSENTSKLEDDKLDELLTIQTFDVGRCHTNVEKVKAVIAISDLPYKVERYAGWLIGVGKTAYHSWVVLDDKYVIDATNLIDVIDAEKELCERSEQGLPGNVSNNMHEVLANIVSSDKKFSKKAIFGQIYGNDVYVGVPIQNTEAVLATVRRLKQAFPNHPDLKGVRLDGGLNETQKKVLAHMN